MVLKRGKRGFVLVGTAVSLVAMIGVLGLVVDLGRAWISRNEAQAFTDSAALAAASRLNNTLAGIDAAKLEVTNSTNKWYFGTKPFTSVITEFSTDRVTWSANPSGGDGYKHVRVNAPSNNVSVLFSTVLGAQSTMNVGAVSVAGTSVPTTFPEGVFPFAPMAHGPNEPNFGDTMGDELTLLWPSSIGSNGQAPKLANLCASDRNQEALNAVEAGVTAERGYIQENSASAIVSAIEDDHMDYTVTLGLSVNRTGGVKTTAVYQSLDARVNQDSSPGEKDYSAYVANHDSSPLRRVVIVPIISDAVNAVVLGFAKVFLPPTQAHNPNNSKCAMYIGPVDLPTGNLASGANIVRLLE